MKHVFYTHSLITTRMSYKIIEHSDLGVDDVIWITARGELVDTESEVLCLEDLTCVLPRKSINFIKCRQQLKKWQQCILSLLNDEDYVCYIPQTQQLLFQLISTHPNCQGYSIVEEGMAAYYKAGYVTQFQQPGILAIRQIIKKWYERLNYGSCYRSSRLLQDSSHINYRGCYAWHPLAFRGFENRVILDCPFVISSSFSGCKAVLVFDAIVESGVVEAAVMTSAIREMFLYLRERKIRDLAVKFHPETTKLPSVPPVWWLKAMEGFESDFSVYWIPREFMVEDLAMRQDQVFIVNLSSVGLYAALMNCQVWSIANLVAKRSVGYAEFLKKLPSVWTNRITTI